MSANCSGGFARERFRDIEAVRACFPHADKVLGLTVFNIAGNKARLIAAIHYNRSKGYIRRTQTRSEYDRGVWKPSASPHSIGLTPPRPLESSPPKVRVSTSEPTQSTFPILACLMSCWSTRCGATA